MYGKEKKKFKYSPVELFIFHTVIYRKFVMIEMALSYTRDLSSALVVTNERREKIVPALILPNCDILILVIIVNGGMDSEQFSVLRDAEFHLIRHAFG